jgi:endonuclease I
MRVLFFFTLSLLCHCLWSQIPSGYYDNTYGKFQGELKTALHQIITYGHSPNTYSSLWIHFEKTDAYTSTIVWDMYSDCDFHFVTKQCGSYSAECDCFNREHSIPLSWMGGGQPMPMYADLHHIVPVDGWTNSKRANYPFSQVGSVQWTSFNGSKLGTSNYPGYSGIAFEPIDEYKGDFARMVFYMVTRYENLLSSWALNDHASSVLDGQAWPAFNQWAVNLYLKWHEEDPVSPKEVARNDSIYKIQNNRNPFIDKPFFARQIWGTDASVSHYAQIQISVYPNPANDYIFFNTTMENGEFVIYDIYGRELKKQQTTRHNQVDISNLSPGIYHIAIQNSNIKTTSKFIVAPR